MRRQSGRRLLHTTAAAVWARHRILIILSLLFGICLWFNFFLSESLSCLFSQQFGPSCVERPQGEEKNNQHPLVVETTQALRHGEELSTAQPLLRSYHASTLASSSSLPPPPPPEATTTVPLHATSGTHHVYVYVGSPPQRQTLIVDTGSRFMAFPCKPCDECGKHDSTEYYDPLVSTTDVVSKCDYCRFGKISHCNNSQCQLTQTYTEGSSWTAYEVQDLLWLGSNDIGESIDHHMTLAVPFVFGCQTSENGLFRTQYADGIMGMAMHSSSFISAMVSSGSIRRHAFALCLTRRGGHMSLGGTSRFYPDGKHFEPMQYTPLVHSRGWYAAKVICVTVGDVVVTLDSKVLDGFNNDKGTILDSGTTDSYLPHAVSKPFMEAWKKLTGRAYTNTRKQYTYDEFQLLPDITIVFEGKIDLRIHPESYMEAAVDNGEEHETDASVQGRNHRRRWDGQKEFTNRIYLDEPRGAVLGVNAMLGYDILFDMEGNRIGIVRADCR